MDSDKLMNSTDVNGKPFDEAHLLTKAMAPYMAKQDTVAGILSLKYTDYKAIIRKNKFIILTKVI